MELSMMMMVASFAQREREQTVNYGLMKGAGSVYWLVISYLISQLDLPSSHEKQHEGKYVNRAEVEYAHTFIYIYKQNFIITKLK